MLIVYRVQRNVSLDYSSYLKRLFFLNGKRIEHSAALQIASLTENSLFHLQLLSWNAFLRTGFTCTQETVNSAFIDLVEEFTLELQNKLENLTVKQYFYLQALLSGQEKLCSKKILNAYKLGRSSNVTRIKENLLKKELIEIHREQVIVIDPLFKYWLSRLSDPVGNNL